jgi:hypothetical protein
LEVVSGRGGGDAGVGLAGEPMEMPVMPGADDVAIGVHMAVAEWTADMVAAAGDRAELAVAVREGEHNFPGLDLLERLGFQVVHTTEPMPLNFAHVLVQLKLATLWLHAWAGASAASSPFNKCWPSHRDTAWRY